MKKQNSTIERSIKYITIYRDDIEEIYSLMARTEKDIVLIIDEYALDSIEEIGQLKNKKATLLKMGTDSYKPSVSVRISQYQAIISTDGSDLLFEFVFTKVIEIINKRKNRVIEFIDEKLVPSILFLFPLLIVGYLYKTSPILLYVASSVLVIMVLSFLIWFTCSMLKVPDSKIYLDYRRDKPSFLQKNRDEIIIGFISLVVGTILGKLF